MPNPPKPTERKRLAGNPGKRPLPEPLTVVPASMDAVPPPKGLQAPGKSLWKRVWDRGQTWLAPTDEPLVTLLCETADERAEVREIVAEEGRFFKTEKGYRATHPAVSQLRALDAQILSCLSLLGFSPTDRTRLGLAEVKRMSHLADLVTRRRAEHGH